MWPIVGKAAVLVGLSEPGAMRTGATRTTAAAVDGAVVVVDVVVVLGVVVVVVVLVVVDFVVEVLVEEEAGVKTRPAASLLAEATTTGEADGSEVGTTKLTGATITPMRSPVDWVCCVRAGWKLEGREVRPGCSRILLIQSTKLETRM